MNSGSSAPIGSGGQSAAAVAIASCHHRSRPAWNATSSPVRRTTTTCSMLGQSAAAKSALAFIGMPPLGPRKAVSWVISSLAGGVVDAVAQRFGGEGAEHDRVHRADAGAGQHRDRQLRHHLQVDADPVALAHAQPLEHVAELPHLLQQFGKGHRGILGRVVALPDDGGVAAVARLDVAVDAVVAGVEGGAGEPGDLRLDEVVAAHPVPAAEPGEPLGHLGPEPLGVAHGALVPLPVLVETVHVGARDRIGGGARRVGICHDPYSASRAPAQRKAPGGLPGLPETENHVIL